MRAGEFPDGSKTLRAKNDMAHPNLNMRDPIMYRILHATHHRTGDNWCIYPTYDWAHGLEDSIEGITHSICTLEFENHRPLYDWFLDQLPIHHPQQIEFARLNLSYTVMSKRKLLQLVEQGLVKSWDDPTAADDFRYAKTRLFACINQKLLHTLSASTNSTAPLTSPYWNTISAKTSTKPAPA